MEFRDAKAELLTGYKDLFTLDELGKLAIDYSDGIVMADKGISKTLQKYAKDKNIPTLAFQGDDFGEAYETFYDQICPDPE